MQPLVEKFLLAFIPLFVAIDPVGLIAIFLGLGGQADAKRRQHEGTLGLITSLALLVNLLLVGFGFRYADHFTRWMGQQWMKGVSKLISLLLAAIAVSLIRRGWLSP